MKVSLSFMRILALSVPISALGACSSLIEGVNQDLTVSTTPAGATCYLYREANTIGTIPSTPGTARIEKTKDDILISCDKAGYRNAIVLNRSDIASWTAGNILVGGVVGWTVDSSLGSDNKYDASIHLNLIPLPAPPPSEPLKWGPPPRSPD